MSVLDLPDVPFHRIQQARVIRQARQIAAVKLANKIGAQPVYVMNHAA